MNKIFKHILEIFIFIIVLPFAVIYFIASMFWVFFGTTIIAFILLMMLGLTDNQCITYAPSLGLLISIIKKVNETTKK